MDLYCSDTSNSWTDTFTCDGNGNFTVQTQFSPGIYSECYSTCTDAAGNTSANPNTVGSEVCTVTDVYELSGIGDDSSNPIGQWNPLLDDGLTTISIVGNVLEDDTDDWYVISTIDDIDEDRAYEIDYYRLDINMVSGTTDYSFLVYKMELRLVIKSVYP